MPIRLYSIILILVPLWIAGCSANPREIIAPSPTAFPVTSTLPPTVTPRPPDTPLPPPPQPTTAPVEGTTSRQINVRAEPSTASNVLGIIPANTKVEIVGKDRGGNWWQILYPAGVDGRGWVTAQYVTTAGRPEVPTLGGDEKNPGSGGNALIIQQLNVRSGPGTSFNSLGILNANDAVRLTGRNSNGAWLQIEFANGPDGRGWVNAAFVKAEGADRLPIVSDTGEVVGTGTPVNTPPPPTPTVVPAPMDHDSADQPLARVKFDPAGTLTLIYHGDVSAPTGDTDDWVAFTPYEEMVFASIECTGSGSIRVELTGSNSTLACGEFIKAVAVPKGIQSILHIQAVSSSGSLEYAKYILTIQASP